MGEGWGREAGARLPLTGDTLITEIHRLSSTALSHKWVLGSNCRWHFFTLPIVVHAVSHLHLPGTVAITACGPAIVSSALSKGHDRHSDRETTLAAGGRRLVERRVSNALQG